MITRRLYRLRPWVVRALIPPGHPGSYVLYRGGRGVVAPTYNGRSDHDLAGRLAMHARVGRGEYFSYDVHPDAVTAFVAECAAYHLRAASAENVIHPASPRGLDAGCPFCSVRGLGRGVSTHPVAPERTPVAAMSKED